METNLHMVMHAPVTINRSIRKSLAEGARHCFGAYFGTTSHGQLQQLETTTTLVLVE